jgi:hypothetical protein
MAVEAYAMHHVPKLRERIWRKLGFRYHLGEEPENVDGLEGWMCTKSHFEFTWLDRVRLLMTGRLMVSTIVHHDTPSADVVKTRLDWRIYAPGERR